MQMQNKPCLLCKAIIYHKTNTSKVIKTQFVRFNRSINMSKQQ